MMGRPGIKQQTAGFNSTSLPTDTLVTSSAWRFSVAPMMAYTDSHCRMLHRQLSRHALLYTEMITSGALIYGDVEKHLAYNKAEHPVALQLGGSDPDDLAKAVTIASEYGYDEYNLNCGCPSDRVQNGSFGACLMAEPERVRDCTLAMREASDVDVTVKCRIGIDDQDDYGDMLKFVSTVAESGVERFTIHARKAWLKGLNPKQNRDVPPLMYDRVERLKQELPQLTIILNGGIGSIAECDQHLQWADGVMLGRTAYHNPWLLSEVDERYFGAAPQQQTRRDVINALLPYLEDQLSRGERFHSIVRHWHGLFLGMRGARYWRRYLGEHGTRRGAGPEVLEHALKLVTE